MRATRVRVHNGTGPARWRRAFAGVVVELVAGGLSPERVGEAELATPHLLDTEVANALRRLVLQGHLTDDQAAPRWRA